MWCASVCFVGNFPDVGLRYKQKNNGVLNKLAGCMGRPKKTCARFACLVECKSVKKYLFVAQEFYQLGCCRFPDSEVPDGYLDSLVIKECVLLKGSYLRWLVKILT